MAGPAPKTEKWTARENQHHHDGKPAGLHLLVGGTVEVPASDLAPQLTVSRTSVGELLALDLTIGKCSDPLVEHGGKPVAVWKAVSYHTVVTADQINRVQIRWDGKVIASTPVINDIEHGELLDKQSEVQNEVAAKETGTGESSVKETVKRVAKAIEDIAEGVKMLKKGPKEVAKKAPPKKEAPPKKKTPPKKTAPPKKKAPPKKTVKKSAKTAKPAAKKTAKKTTKKVVKKAMPKQKKTKRR